VEIIYKKVKAEDYGDILDIAKDIWGGSDYLPHVFHQWVEDKGYFLGAYNRQGKLVGCSKLTFLLDKTGWLEGLRVHVDYRNLGIGKELAKRTLDIAKNFLQKGEIERIAFATHVTNRESIHINSRFGYQKIWQNIIVSKDDNYLPKMKKEEFKVEHFQMTYQEFMELEYTKKHKGLISLAFRLEKATEEVIAKMNKKGQFISINGYKGMFENKGEISFESFELNPEAIHLFYEYFSIIAKEQDLQLPCTTLLEEELIIKDQLVQYDFETWYDWQPDYFYYELT
jgi:RimJ/RimL family protein N-acetyltransferase